MTRLGYAGRRLIQMAPIVVGVTIIVFSSIPLVGLGMPAFWVGIVLILLLGLKAGLFPVGGYGEGFLGHLDALFLPGLTVAISISPRLIRAFGPACWRSWSPSSS